ncbi:MAG: peroxide stress protein YaaA [Saprospiraceae bacterium]|nr:peroxide stress protein YaaA [Saprospiraceae bacterium]
MIILLSPAKSLDFSPVATNRSQARFKQDTAVLAEIMKSKTTGDLKDMMHISDKLADLNHERFQQFSASHSKKNSKQAAFAFQGDVYQGLQTEKFTPAQLEFAQEHVRILSGLYGLLRPLDAIQPYRLEMGTKLKTERGNSLYDFWGEKITHLINKDLAKHRHKVIINLASNEYFKAVQAKELDGDLYTIDFREYRDGKPKFISFSAKKARGFMTQYIVRKKITNPKKLLGFDLEGYRYDADLSKGPHHLMFTR